jgi:hypothetical protein
VKATTLTSRTVLAVVIQRYRLLMTQPVMMMLGAPQRSGFNSERWWRFPGLAKNAENAYLRRMFEFCLPTSAKIVPDRPEWLHEVKYDGYRIRLDRDGERVRLITLGGYDWTKRYPWTVEAALKNRTSISSSIVRRSS